MTPFDNFLSGLRADARLGRYIPPASANTSAETLILSLAISLADATEGKRPHPAHLLLDELDAMEAAR